VSSTLLAYEDQYHDNLHLLIKKLRRDAALPGIILEKTTVRGTGGFINDVPKLLRTPLKQTRKPPDRLICLADADRPQNLVPGSPGPPAGDDGTSLDSWIVELEAAWLEHLRGRLNLPPADETRLRVVVLRWSKESLLIASPDALLEYAQKHERGPQVRALLANCDPDPWKAADREFMTAYQEPRSCLDVVFREIEERSYKKGRDDEDLLRDHIIDNHQRRTELRRRCPDLDRLLAELS
jgi:hypothetical protein